MHPLGMYFAITTSDREQRWADDDERAGALARAAARPIARREPTSRVGRLAGILRRRLIGTARA